MHRFTAFRGLLLGTLLLAGPVVRAETFLLKSGGRIDGELQNPRRAPTEPYQLKTALGLKLSLTPSQVSRVVVKSDVQKQYDAQVLAMANTPEGHWQLAEWCKETGLLDARKRHLEAALELDPEHEKARAALGFERTDGQWLTTEDRMRAWGLVWRNGKWKEPQQLELEAAARESELAVKRLRRDILMWIDQLSGSRRESALQSLAGLRDPRAAPALVELLNDKHRSPEIRKLCLEILGRMPPGLAGAAVITLAMDEPDAEIRDRCLDEVVRMKASGVASVFVGALKSKDNKRVNRAATCLARLEDPDSTLPLINALVTTHEYLIMPGGGGGLSFNSAGGFSAGGRPEKKKQELQNTSVLTALRTLHPGARIEYDEAAWRKWYVEKFTTTKVDLRRDE